MLILVGMESQGMNASKHDSSGNILGRETILATPFIQGTMLSWSMEACCANGAPENGAAASCETLRIGTQAAVCLGFTAAVIWRMHAAAAARAARDEERPLLEDAEEGAACPKHARGVGRLVHCAAVSLIGGMAAGLVGLVRAPIPDIPCP